MSEGSPQHANAVLRHVVSSIVTQPDEIEVTETHADGKVELLVKVAKADMGRVIGRRGRVANAIRTVVAAAAVQDGVTVEVEFLE
jgi:hypothetical protein